MKPWNSFLIAFLGGVLSLVPLYSRADAGQDAAQQSAIAAYKAGDFETSYRIHDSLYHAGFESAALCYNLGNAAYKLGKIGHAVLWYERSLKQDPDFEDARFNLKLAQSRVVDKVVTPPEFFLKRLTMNWIRAQAAGGWALMAVIAIWLAAACGIGFFLVKTEMLRRVTFFVGIIAVLIGLTTMGFSLYQRGRMRLAHEGVVMAQNVYVKSSPNSEGTDLFIVHEGLKVHLLGKQDGWMRIRLGDGKSGWLPAGEVQGI